MHHGFVLVAAESVQFVDNDIISTPLGAVCYHLLKGKTVIVCSRHRAVDISIKYDYAFILCVFFADTQLSFDRLLGLIVARISCVNYCDIFLWTLKPVNVKINI